MRKPAKAKARRFGFTPPPAPKSKSILETGKVRVLRVATAVDVGKAIHPQQCDLQNEGSALAGLGSALFEEMRFDNGQPINCTFLDYLFRQCSITLMNFNHCSSKRPTPTAPPAPKAWAKRALPPMAPAIGNAIANALNGVRVRELPLKPHKIVAALRAAKETR